MAHNEGKAQHLGHSGVDQDLCKVLHHSYRHRPLPSASDDAVGNAPHNARERERHVLRTDRRLHSLSLWQMYLCLFGIAISYVEAELLFDNEYVPTTTITVLKAISSASTVALLCIVCTRYYFKTRLMRLRGLIDPAESFRHSGLLLPFVVELCVCAVHAPPGLDFTFDMPNFDFYVRYSIDHMCSLWQLFRLYSVVIVFDYVVGYHTTQARVIAKWNDVSFNTAFTFKAMMERAPFLFFGTMFTVVTIGFSYALRVFEMPLCVTWLETALLDFPFCQPHSYELYDHRFFANSVWSIVITMTTVGYGDTYPITMGGRAIVVIASLTGTAVVALIVSFVMGATQFQADERRAFNALYRTQSRKKFLDAAARLIQSVWKFYLVKNAAYKRAIMQYHQWQGRGRRSSQVIPQATERTHSGGNDAFGLVGSGLASRVDVDEEKCESPRIKGPSLPSTQHKISLESPRQSTVRLRQAMFGSSNHAILKNFRATVAAGMSKLLHTLRIWKKRRNEYLDLHKEKSELAMIMKELLDLRLSTTEISEDTAGMNLFIEELLNKHYGNNGKHFIPESLQRVASNGKLKRAATSHSGSMLLGRLHGTYADDTLGMGGGGGLSRKRSRQELAALRFARRQFQENEED